MNRLAQCAAAGAVAAVVGFSVSIESAQAGPLALSGSVGLVAPGAQVEQAHYRRHRHYYGYRPYYGYHRAYPRYYARPQYYYPSYGYYPAYSYPAYGWRGYGWGW